MIFHHSDLDGIGSAIVTTMFLDHKYSIELTRCGNDDVDYKVLKFYSSGEYRIYDKVYILDMSLKETTMDFIIEMGYANKDNFTLIDHHITALGLLKYSDKVDINIDTEFSATKLTSIYLEENTLMPIDEDMDSFIETVDSYDTWRWKSEGYEIPYRLNLILGKIGFDEFYYDWTTDDRLNVDIYMDRYNKLVNSVMDEMNEYILDKLKKVKIQSFRQVNRNLTIAICVAENYISLLADKIMDTEKVDIVMIMTDIDTFSLRTSSSDIDVSKIAKELGGGGHRRASGFTKDVSKLLISIL